MENKNMRKLNVTVQCMAVYNSSIMVPRELTFEEAIKYAKEHIDEINLGELEYISDSDELDEENCDFDEEEDTDSDCRVLYETGIEEPEILGSGSTYSNVATCICDIYERIGRLECRLENTQRDLGTAIEQNRQHTEGLLSQQTDVENKIDIALTTAVHELIEYLRYQDIQALDEEEFLLRVRELIRVEQDEHLPF